MIIIVVVVVTIIMIVIIIAQNILIYYKFCLRECNNGYDSNSRRSYNLECSFIDCFFIICMPITISDGRPNFVGSRREQVTPIVGPFLNLAYLVGCSLFLSSPLQCIQTLHTTPFPFFPGGSAFLIHLETKGGTRYLSGEPVPCTDYQALFRVRRL